jgi:hypothetical protein
VVVNENADCSREWSFIRRNARWLLPYAVWFSAIAVIALNEFVATNETLAISPYRPLADPQDNFNEGALLADTGHWRFYENAVGLVFRVRFMGQFQRQSATDYVPVALPAM